MTRADAPNAQAAVSTDSAAQAEHLDIKAATEDDLLWAFHALGSENPAKEDCPSPGAWSLYIFAREDSQLRNKVYERVLPKPKKTAEDESAPEDMMELTQLDAQIADEWGEVAGIITALSKNPELIAPVQRAIKRATK